MTEAEWIAFLQRPEIPAFNRAMLVNPDDDLPRLVFADWMDENCPDVEVNRAVRESITNDKRIAAWPSSLPHDSWKVSLTRGRVRLRIVWADRHPAPPSHRRAHNLLEAVWRAGWVEALEFGRGQFNSLAGWFSQPAMGGVTALNIGGGLLFPHNLQQMLGSPELSRVRTLTLDGWQSGSEVIAVLTKCPLLTRLRSLHLTRIRLDFLDVWNLVELPTLAELEDLTVRSCDLNDDGAMAIAYSSHLTNLKHLNLDHNRFRTPGAAALADSPYLCEAIRAQWRRSTDDGGVNS